LGDRQSSHPVKTLLQYYGKSLEALPGVAYPGFTDNRSTLNTKTGLKKRKKSTHHEYTFVGGPMAPPNKSNMAAVAFFNFGKMSITPD